MQREIRRIFAESTRIRTRFLREGGTELVRVIELTRAALSAGRTLFFFGNGGSAADAQHLAAEFVNRFRVDRRALPALALTTDTSAITSIANDFGYRYVFARQIEAFAQEDDVAFAISTSGNSASVLEAVRRARRRGVQTVGLTGGDGGKLAGLVDHLLCVAGTRDTARIQEAHILIGHTLCELVETDFPSGADAAPAACRQAPSKRTHRGPTEGR